MSDSTSVDGRRDYAPPAKPTFVGTVKDVANSFDGSGADGGLYASVG